MTITERCQKWFDYSICVEKTLPRLLVAVLLLLYLQALTSCICSGFMQTVCFIGGCRSNLSYVSCIMYRFDSGGQFWHSSLITERLHRRVVRSSTGTTYRLVGKIVKPLALAQGIRIKCTALVVDILFVCIFLHNWYVHELFVLWI